MSSIEVPSLLGVNMLSKHRQGKQKEISKKKNNGITLKRQIIYFSPAWQKKKKEANTKTV